MNKFSPQKRVKEFEKKQIVVSVLVLLIFTGLALIFNTLHIQSIAEDNTKFLSRLVKIGDFREAALILQEARLSKFVSIRYESSVLGRSFTLPPSAELVTKKSFWRIFSTDEYSTIVEDALNSRIEDKIVYEFSRFRFIPHALLIWLILNLVSIPQTRFMKKRLIEQFYFDLELEKKAAKSELAQQVRHNLRTPLAALMRIPSRLPASVSKDKDLLEMTINQIKELITKLDDKPDQQLSDKNQNNIYETLIQARRELELFVPKSIDFHFEIDDMISSTLVSHIPVELRSILGNLVTNSVEAIKDAGRIRVQARDLGAEIEILVVDSGFGIPQENLPKIFDKNFSFGKKNGSGIGLSHAKQHVELCSGRISADSVLNLGTTIKIRLPIHDREKWYVSRLKFTENSKIFVVDDQKSGRELWRAKFDEAKLLSQVYFADHIKDDESNLMQIKDSPQEWTLLFDYDLATDKNGLDWLKRFPKTANRYLVTGHFDSNEVREACLKSNVGLIPKSQITELSLVVV